MPTKKTSNKASPPNTKDPSTTKSTDSAELREPPLTDETDWLPEPIEQLLVGPAGPGIAQGLCELLNKLILSLEAGETNSVVSSLREGISVYYRFTTTHRLALRHFCLHLERNLDFKDEPEQLLAAVIERAEGSERRGPI